MHRSGSAGTQGEKKIKTKKKKRLVTSRGVFLCTFRVGEREVVGSIGRGPAGSKKETDPEGGEKLRIKFGSLTRVVAFRTTVRQPCCRGWMT